MSDDDRAKRLRETRQNVKSKGEDETSEPSETDNQSVKDERVGTYMYLTESQKKDVEKLYSMMKAKYEYEYGDFEKNRHFYPLLIKFGLDGLEGLDAQEIQEHLDSLGVQTINSMGET